MIIAHFQAFLPGTIVGLAIAIPAIIAGTIVAHASTIRFTSLAFAALSTFGLISIALAPELEEAASEWVALARSVYPTLGLPLAGFVMGGLIRAVMDKVWWRAA